MKTWNSIVRRGVVAAGAIFILSAMTHSFRLFVPHAWLIGLLPATILVLAVALTPTLLRPELRLGLTSLVIVLMFVVLRVESARILRIEFIFLTAVWGVGQIGLVIAGGLVLADTRIPLLQSLHEFGYLTTIKKALLGRLGISIAQTTNAAVWAALILIGSVLLWQSDSLDYIESTLLYGFTSREPLPGAPRSIVVTLTTPDNNPRKYLQTALEMCRAFQRAGALVTSFPRRAILDSAAQRYADSISASGGLTYVQPLPKGENRFGRWGYGVLQYQAVDLSWASGKPLIHPGLAAVARIIGRPVRMSYNLRQRPPLRLYDPRIPTVPNAFLSIGDIEIPLESDGSSAVLFGYWKPVRTARDGSRFLAEFEKVDWDSALSHFDILSGKHVKSLPDSVWNQAVGKMVFVQWVNQGEDFRRDDATVPAMVADRVASGLVVGFAAPWHLGVTCLILLVSVILSSTTRPAFLVAFLVGCTVGLLTIDSWMFVKNLLVSNLIYPAFTSVLAAVILPLVRIPEAASEQLVAGASDAVNDERGLQ